MVVAVELRELLVIFLNMQAQEFPSLQRVVALKCMRRTLQSNLESFYRLYISPRTKRFVSGILFYHVRIQT
jgi:hypothetical protein